LTRTTERLVDFRRSLVPLVVLDELYIDRLIWPNAHEVEGGTTLSDHLQVGRILCIVEPSERSIFNAETILPEV
jgi:hypothetical protein